MTLYPSSVVSYLAPSESYATLRVPVRYVARVDAALKREGLDVTEIPDGDGSRAVVTEGNAPAGVPALLSGSGPALPRGWVTP